MIGSVSKSRSLYMVSIDFGKLLFLLFWYHHHPVPPPLTTHSLLSFTQLPLLHLLLAIVPCPLLSWILYLGPSRLFFPLSELLRIGQQCPSRHSRRHLNVQCWWSLHCANFERSIYRISARQTVSRYNMTRRGYWKKNMYRHYSAW